MLKMVVYMLDDGTGVLGGSHPLGSRQCRVTEITLILFCSCFFDSLCPSVEDVEDYKLVQ